jgi:hypothetical protein
VRGSTARGANARGPRPFGAAASRRREEARGSTAGPVPLPVRGSQLRRGLASRSGEAAAAHRTIAFAPRMALRHM